MKVSPPASGVVLGRTQSWLLATASGAAIAVLGGLIGLGGAEFRLPVLMGVFGLAARQAVPLNLLISLVTVATALASRMLGGAFAPAWEWRLGVLTLAAGGVLGARVGVRLAGRLHDATLERVIGALLAAIAALLGFEVALGNELVGPLATTNAAVSILGLVFGVAIGVVSSLLGVAGGELLIPTFVFMFGAGMKIAGTASLLVSLPTVSVGVLRYRAQGAYAAREALRDIGLPMALGSLVGAVLGTRLVGWIDVALLKALLGIVLGISAIRLWRHRSEPVLP